MSRADTTLDDWLGASDEAEPEEQADAERAVSAEQWEPETPHCQCGASLSEWHSAAGARRMVRVFGDTDEGTVPGCPACVDWGHGETSMDQKVESVAHAIKALPTTSSVERQSRRKLVLQEVGRDE